MYAGYVCGNFINMMLLLDVYDCCCGINAQTPNEYKGVARLIIAVFIAVSNITEKEVGFQNPGFKRKKL